MQHLWNEWLTFHSLFHHWDTASNTNNFHHDQMMPRQKGCGDLYGVASCSPCGLLRSLWSLSQQAKGSRCSFSITARKQREKWKRQGQGCTLQVMLPLAHPSWVPPPTINSGAMQFKSVTSEHRRLSGDILCYTITLTHWPQIHSCSPSYANYFLLSLRVAKFLQF